MQSTKQLVADEGVEFKNAVSIIDRIFIYRFPKW